MLDEKSKGSVRLKNVANALAAKDTENVLGKYGSFVEGFNWEASGYGKGAGSQTEWIKKLIPLKQKEYEIGNRLSNPMAYYGTNRQGILTAQVTADRLKDIEEKKKLIK